jgi:hypothetical protein
MALPEHERARAMLNLKAINKRTENLRGVRSQASRDVNHRRGYAMRNDPWGYIHDILGWELSQQENDVLDALVKHSRVLVPSANNCGKTFTLAAYGIYRFDAVAALEDPNTGDREQGARILLPGPDHDTVFQTLYSEMLTHARRAESRGHLMPGERSDRSVLWQVRPKWNMEAFSPPARVQEQVTHKASGRHHRNQVALIEEGQGVPEPVWRAAEGMCSAAGNQIISTFNPTEPIGPAYMRARTGAYHVQHLSAFDHPNVIERKLVIPPAVDFKVVDARVRVDCRDRGPFPGTPIEPEHHDFVYALAEPNAREVGARSDGYRGHPHGKLRVYRPGGTFTAQVLGQWPQSAEDSLFNPAAIDASMARWRESQDPTTPPDRVGVDVAREGKDDAAAAPSWGATAESILRAWFDAELRGPLAMANIRVNRRIRIGEIRVLPKGDGVDIARHLIQLFPRSPFNVDETGVGSSPLDHLRRVLHRDVFGVAFGSAATPPITDAEPWSENLRTQLYVRLALLVNRGLVDLPDSPTLREELLAHSLHHGDKTFERLDRRTNQTVKERVPSVALLPKDKIKKLIGRSPDLAEACVLSVFGRPPVPVGVSQSTFKVR